MRRSWITGVSFRETQSLKRSKVELKIIAETIAFENAQGKSEGLSLTNGYIRTFNLTSHS